MWLVERCLTCLPRRTKLQRYSRLSCAKEKSSGVENDNYSLFSLWGRACKGLVSICCLFWVTSIFVLSSEYIILIASCLKANCGTSCSTLAENNFRSLRCVYDLISIQCVARPARVQNGCRLGIAVVTWVYTRTSIDGGFMFKLILYLTM